MRLQEIQITGFGKLVDRRFEFGTGFNLIFGPNEAGKSTLQRAILSILYGFFDEGPIKAAMRAELSALTPWQEKVQYGGYLIYSLDSGQTYTVTRRIGARASTIITTYPEGKDITAQFRSDSHARLYFAERHLGMNREVFENTCHIRQAELVALQDSASAITDALMRLATSASADSTANEAIEALQRASRDQVGTDRAWTKPLAMARTRLRELEAERANVQQARRDVLAWKAEMQVREMEIRDATLESQRLRYLQVLSEHENLSGKIAATNDTVAELEQLRNERERLQGWSTFPKELRDELLTLSARRQTLQEQLRATEERAQSTASRRAELEAQTAEVQGQITALGELQPLSEDQVAVVQELARQARSAAQAETILEDQRRIAALALEKTESALLEQRDRIKPLVDLGYGGFADLERSLASANERWVQARARHERAAAEWRQVGMSDEQFAQLERTAIALQTGAQPTPPARKGCSWPFGRAAAPAANQTPTEVTLYNQIMPIRDTHTAASLEVDSAAQALSNVQEALRRHLGPTLDYPDVPVDAAAVERGKQQLNTYLQSSALVDQQARLLQDLDAKLDEARKATSVAQLALKSRLAQLGFGGDNSESSLAAFSAQFAGLQELHEAEVRLAELQRQARSSQQDLDDLAVRREAIVQVDRRIGDLLAKAGITYQPDEIDSQTRLDGALEEFNEGVRQYDAWTKIDAAYRQVAARVGAMDAVSAPIAAERATSPANLPGSGGRDEHRLHALAAQLDSLRSAHPEWHDLRAERTAQEYAQLEWQAESTVREKQSEYDQLRSKIERTTAGLRHPADIDEEITAARSEVDYLEAVREALELAASELTGAMGEFQKQFAPKLEALVSEGVHRVTQGRYREVRVDPTTLAVTLRAPELGELVGVERLSAGTRDLVYLMLRIAIARLMSRNDEALPLLLDDPLVHLDIERQEQALSFLSLLAQETQVLLFTKDERVCTWVESQLQEARILRL